MGRGLVWTLAVVLVLGGGVIGTLVFLSHGTAALGEECSFSSDCRQGTCERVEDLRRICTYDCTAAPCPPRFRCAAIELVTRRGGTVERTETVHYCRP